MGGGIYSFVLCSTAISWQSFPDEGGLESEPAQLRTLQYSELTVHVPQPNPPSSPSTNHHSNPPSRHSHDRKFWHQTEPAAPRQADGESREEEIPKRCLNAKLKWNVQTDLKKYVPHRLWDYVSPVCVDSSLMMRYADLSVNWWDHNMLKQFINKSTINHLDQTGCKNRTYPQGELFLIDLWKWCF